MKKFIHKNVWPLLFLTVALFLASNCMATSMKASLVSLSTRKTLTFLSSTPIPISEKNKGLWKNMPEEIVNQIIDRLPVTSSVNLSKTAKDLKAAVNSEELKSLSAVKKFCGPSIYLGLKSGIFNYIILQSDISKHAYFSEHHACLKALISGKALVTKNLNHFELKLPSRDVDNSYFQDLKTFLSIKPFKTITVTLTDRAGYGDQSYEDRDWNLPILSEDTEKRLLETISGIKIETIIFNCVLSDPGKINTLMVEEVHLRKFSKVKDSFGRLDTLKSLVLIDRHLKDSKENEWDLFYSTICATGKHSRIKRVQLNSAMVSETINRLTSLNGIKIVVEEKFSNDFVSHLLTMLTYPLELRIHDRCCYDTDEMTRLLEKWKSSLKSLEISYYDSWSKDHWSKTMKSFVNDNKILSNLSISDFYGHPDTDLGFLRSASITSFFYANHFQMGKSNTFSELFKTIANHKTLTDFSLRLKNYRAPEFMDLYIQLIDAILNNSKQKTKLTNICLSLRYFQVNDPIQFIESFSNATAALNGLGVNFCGVPVESFLRKWTNYMHDFISPKGNVFGWYLGFQDTDYITSFLDLN